MNHPDAYWHVTNALLIILYRLKVISAELDGSITEEDVDSFVLRMDIKMGQIMDRT